MKIHEFQKYQFFMNSSAFSISGFSLKFFTLNGAFQTLSASIYQYQVWGQNGSIQNVTIAFLATSLDSLTTCSNTSSFSITWSEESTSHMSSFDKRLIQNATAFKVFLAWGSTSIWDSVRWTPTSVDWVRQWNL